MVESCWGFTIPPEKSRDIYKQIIEKVTGNANSRVKGYKLEDCCVANKLTTKSNDGAMAPVLWQRKRFMEVIDYCVNDVLMTKELLELIWEDNNFIDPVTGQLIDFTPGKQYET